MTRSQRQCSKGVMLHRVKKGAFYAPFYRLSCSLAGQVLMPSIVTLFQCLGISTFIAFAPNSKNLDRDFLCGFRRKQSFNGGCLTLFSTTVVPPGKPSGFPGGIVKGGDFTLEKHMQSVSLYRNTLHMLFLRFNQVFWKDGGKPHSCKDRRNSGH